LKGRNFFVNVTCDKCNKRYSIADDKVRGKSVKIRCKQCQNLISVQGPAASPAGVELGGVPGVSAAAPGSPWEEERTRAMPAMDNTAQWFAMVKGKQLGPFDLKGLEGKVKTGELTLRTYLWKQGMGDWKRASDVPEVSPVFAGVSVGATATGPTSAATERPSSKRVPAVQRDVAVALETPSPEITARKTNGNGNGHGHSMLESVPDAATQPVSRPRIQSQAKAPAISRPAPAAEPMPEPGPTAPVPAPFPKKTEAPLSDLFGGEGENAQSDQGPIGDIADSGEEVPKSEPNDPFAALGEADPSQAPPPGEATKFFIAQAGVNKRNPPWKIALFILGGPGLIIGTLFVLSTLKIVPLEVTRTNEKGEEVKESFFSSGGVSGIKDLFSGDAAKKKAEAEKAKQVAAEKRRQHAIGERHEKPDKPDRPDKPVEAKPVDPALALIYGNPSGEKETKGPRVRAEDRPNQQTVDTAGLSQEASQKVMADKLKAFEGCIEQALRRNPNLAVGPIDVVLNVGASGAVTSASISPTKHNNSDWGQCMRDVAKRIVFPKSDGDTEVSLPLKVGVALSP
jgi:predicted Zn finger-like uncharacterized protein